MTDNPPQNPQNPPKQQPKDRRHRRCYNKDLPTPTEIYDFLHSRRQNAVADGREFNPAEFIAGMPDLDLTDPMALHGMIEQQCNLLNRAFHLLLLGYDEKSYDLAFKAQRLIRENLPIVERYAGHHLSVYDHADDDTRPHMEQIQALYDAWHHHVPVNFVKADG